jgi:glycine/D-amino acid oxidase-like deaminating enzyme
VDPDLSPSFWLSTLDSPVTARPTLPGDREADIAIVGAGYTGLWTAYYLASGDPSVRIAVLEAEYAGFGASGRNGGWCSGLFPGRRLDPRPSLRPGPRGRPVPRARGRRRRGRAGDRRRGDRLLPWVGHRFRKWEPEPVRWLGINAALLWNRLLP